MVVEAQATPRHARKVIEKIREVTDKPITHLVLAHYHAVRVLGASAYGAQQIIMSDVAHHITRASVTAACEGCKSLEHRMDNFLAEGQSRKFLTSNQQTT